MIAFVIHELSHVIFYNYHRPFKFSELEYNYELLEVNKYHTQLEGLGVYIPYRYRLKTNTFFHQDYHLLRNRNEIHKMVKLYNDLIQRLKEAKDDRITDKSWEIIGTLADKRMWYVIGAFIAGEIENKIGRAGLIQTIVNGPENFFETYKNLMSKINISV